MDCAFNCLLCISNILTVRQHHFNPDRHPAKQLLVMHVSLSLYSAPNPPWSSSVLPEKQGNFQRGAPPPPPHPSCFLPPYSAVQSPHPATILREGVFELPESEFVMIWSKAKGDAAKNRVVYIRPSREGGQIKQPL